MKLCLQNRRLTLTAPKRNCLLWLWSRKTSTVAVTSDFLARMETNSGVLKYYQPDWNWVRVGLKCLQLYGDGNEDWLAMNGNAREWAVGFHGSSNKGTENIAKTRQFKKGSGQAHKSSKDVNTLSDSCGKVCGEEVYFGDRIDIAEWYRSQAEPSDELVCVLQVKQFTSSITSIFVHLNQYLGSNKPSQNTNSRKPDLISNRQWPRRHSALRYLCENASCEITRDTNVKDERHNLK